MAMTEQEQKAVEEKCDEFCEYRRTHSNGYPPREWFMAGVKALDDLRKPSEPAIMEILTDHDEIKAEMDRMLGFGEPERGITITMVGEPSEELVEKIHETLDECVGEMGFYKISKRIAKLMQPDVNVELLEALKMIKELNGGDVTGNETWFLAQQAISNYEKQQGI